MGENSETNEAENQRTLAIATWMLSNIQHHGYRRYDDLHIDQIDPAWQSRESWIAGSATAFQIAATLRDHHLFDFTVAIAFSLGENDQPRGDFRTPDELATRLDASPPSLYLFERGKEPWMETSILKAKLVADGVRVEHIKADAFGIFGSSKRCHYMEFRQLEFEEYSCTFFIES